MLNKLNSISKSNIKLINKLKNGVDKIKKKEVKVYYKNKKFSVDIWFLI